MLMKVEIKICGDRNKFGVSRNTKFVLPINLLLVHIHIILIRNKINILIILDNNLKKGDWDNSFILTILQLT